MHLDKSKKQGLISYISYISLQLYKFFRSGLNFLMCFYTDHITLREDEIFKRLL